MADQPDIEQIIRLAHASGRDHVVFPDATTAYAARNKFDAIRIWRNRYGVILMGPVNLDPQRAVPGLSWIEISMEDLAHYADVER